VPTPFPVWAISGIRRRVLNVLFHAKFHRDWRIMYNHANVTDFGFFWVYPRPSAIWGQIWHARVRPHRTLTYNIYRINMSRLKGFTTTPILPFFQLQHSAVALSDSVETKLNTAAQLQTFPYPTVPTFSSRSCVHKLCH